MKKKETGEDAFSDRPRKYLIHKNELIHIEYEPADVGKSVFLCQRREECKLVQLRLSL